MKKRMSLLLVATVCLSVFTACTSQEVLEIQDSQVPQQVEAEDVASAINSDVMPLWELEEVEISLPVKENMRLAHAFPYMGHSALLVYVGSGGIDGIELCVVRLDTSDIKNIYKSDQYFEDAIFFTEHEDGNFTLQNTTQKLTYDRITGNVTVGNIAELLRYSYSDNGYVTAIEGFDSYKSSIFANSMTVSNSPSWCDFSSSGSLVAYFTDVSTVNILNTEDLSVKAFRAGQDFGVVEDIVNYNRVYYTGDDSAVVLEGYKEDGSGFMQVIDCSTGTDLAIYEGSAGQETNLLDTFGCKILISEGEKFKSNILCYDFKTGENETILELEGRQMISAKHVLYGDTSAFIMVSSDGVGADVLSVSFG